MMILIVGIIRTMVAELVPERELQPRAFSIMPLVWSLGSVVGPPFGGFFSNPAKNFPNVFGKMEYFIRFPYALPNLLATVFFLISATCATFFLKVSNLRGIAAPQQPNLTKPHRKLSPQNVTRRTGASW